MKFVGTIITSLWRVNVFLMINQASYSEISLNFILHSIPQRKIIKFTWAEQICQVVTSHVMCIQWRRSRKKISETISVVFSFLCFLLSNILTHFQTMSIIDILFSLLLFGCRLSTMKNIWNLRFDWKNHNTPKTFEVYYVYMLKIH